MASIKKDPKTNKWYYRISYKDKNGNFRTKTKKGFKTKAEAVNSVNLLDVNDLINEVDTSPITFADFFENWCHTFKIGLYSPKNDAKYISEINFVRNFFGNTLLKDITRQQCQDYINYRGISNTKETTRKSLSRIRSCLKIAFADGLIERDPTLNIINRAEKTSNKSINYLSYNQLKSLVEHLYTSSTLPDTMLLIAALTGLRIGEVYGLSYNDFSPTLLNVERGYDYTLTNKFTDGKTTSSKRKVIIPKQLYTHIQTFRIQNQIHNPTYLFLDKYNKPRISHNGLSKSFKKTLETLELPLIKIHGLRHTHASVLIYQNMNIHYISKRLGHSSVTETIDTYSHIIDELNQKQDKHIEKILEFSAESS